MKVNKILFFIFFLAFLVRLIAINQSLWLDEGTTARVVQEYGFTRIVSGFLQNDFHPPLYYLFMKLWTSVWGYSEVALRMPSIIFSLLTGYFIYKIAKLLIGPSTSLRTNFSDKSEKFGIWATIFFLFNPLIVYYSQEARMYSMATCLLTIGFYYLLMSLRVNELGKNQKLNIKKQNDNEKLKIEYTFSGIFFSLALATFYGSVFFIAASLLYLLLKKQYKLLLITSYCLLFTLLILSPLLYQQLINAKESVSLVTNWSLVLGKANLKNLLIIPIKFTSGRISWFPKWSYYVVTSYWLLVTGYLFIKGVLKNKLVFYCFMVPLLLGFFVSFVTPLLQYFRFLYLIVPMSLLLAIGADKKWQRYLLLTGFLIFSLIYLINTQFHREDWKSLAKSLPNNVTVYAISSSMDALKFYKNDSGFMIHDLRSLEKPVNSLTRELVNNLIVIPYTSEIYGLDYKTKLIEKKYLLKKIENFRGLSYEYWSMF